MKIKTLLITLALTLSLLTSTAFATDLSSFSDVTTSHWAYSTIMQAVDLGLFNGTTTPDENGVATFSPDADMTRAAFLVVACRAVGIEFDTTGSWYLDAVEQLISVGIITRNDFSGEYETAMTRQEMAYVMANVLEYTGETLKEDISSSRIPDYSKIGTYYNDEVVTVYSNGILQGTDSDGTFSPMGTLSRAQAATVLIRLVDSTARADTQSDAEYYAEQSKISTTITEGLIHENVAKAGDTFVKSDGTTVVLAYGENGILGEGQGVAPDLGLVGNGGNILVSGSKYTTTDSSEVDSFGNSLNGQTYKVNPITGCGHWGSELTVLNNATYPTSDGTFKYELSDDCNWIWTGSTWMSCFNMGDTADVATILELNGL